MSFSRGIPHPAQGFCGVLLILVAFVWPGAAFADSDPAAQANRLFVQAMQAIQKADQTYDPQEQAKFLMEADKLLSDIITRLPESPLAVQLVTNQFIGDFDYVAFQSRIRGLVCAEPQATGCFLHRIETMMPPLEYPIAGPRWDWLSLAVAHWHLGDRGRVKPIIAPFVMALRRSAPPAEGSQDLFLGRALALTGEPDLALRITRSIADCSTRIYNLTDIAEALVWQGEGTRATAVAEEAADYARANACAWELGLVAQALLRVGDEGRARTLFLNTVEEQFSRFKERRGTCCPPELAVAAGDLGDVNLALGLLRTVQEESPWTVPQVLGKLGARGEKTLTLTFADQIADMELKAETYVELIGASLKAGDRRQADLVSTRLDGMLKGADKSPLVLIQRARADRLLFKDQRWRPRFQQALDQSDREGQARRDVAVPFLAALVEIETGRAMLE
ncbi:hypothetical protein [Rhodospirillum centenum]|uniref:hypothetical protein n=1 Tax=Rhodospirillum centenum TaxID=34018 RepID=UPI00161AFE3A|nr:hypothetical protein [Rhodospirillum centenum]